MPTCCANSATLDGSEKVSRQPRVLAKLGDERIAESSGLACSWTRADAFWTHNDSGDEPRLYAFDKQGKSLGMWDVSGAEAVDWEDMCAVRIDGVSYLLIADFGDNHKKRRQCMLYIVPEPDLSAATDARHVKSIRTIPFVYEDGPRDCEAVAVAADEKAIYLISKTVAPSSVVYTLPWSSEKDGVPSQPAVARAVASPRLMMVTSMDFSADGRRAVVLTYHKVYEFLRNEGEKWPEAFERKPRRFQIKNRQWEAVCYGRDGKTIYLTSEGRAAPLIEMREDAAGQER